MSKASPETSLPSGKLFSSGNHAVEIMKGMLHFGEPSVMVCMLGVPSTMTVRDLIQFLSPCSETLENTRILREVTQDPTYLVLLKFRSVDTAQEFYSTYDGIQYNSIETDTCHLLFVTRLEVFAEDSSHREEANCAVCLEKMDTSDSLVTILCGHSFHTHCLAKWGDTSCPVCRYCQTPESQVENKCMECEYQQDSLWMCIICGHVGCGRYVEGHAYEHFRETQHTYAMQLTDNQVWDYAGDNYVHRLLANKTDGKPVEVEGSDAHRQAEEKIEAVQLEYTYLLTQQLDSQRKYFEKQMHEAEKNHQKKVKELVTKNKKLNEDLSELQESYQTLTKEKAAVVKKLNQLSTKHAKAQSELVEEKELNKSLGLNQSQWQKKLSERVADVERKDKTIKDLEDQLRDLMFFLEARDKINDSVTENVVSRDEIQDSHVVIDSTPTTSGRRARPSKNRRK